MPNFSAAEDLNALHALLEQAGMKNGWAKRTPSLYPEPRHDFVASRWRYADARAALHAAGRLVGTEWAERRNLIMANPVPGNEYPTVASLVGAYQMVKAGETARSHRHTPNAMRIVLEAAPRTYTVVDGKKVPMLPGDVLLTPNWCWHGHSNESDMDAYWIDILDAPLVQRLGPMFFEHHPDAVEPAAEVDERSPTRFAYAQYKPRLLAAPQAAPGVRTLELGPPTLPSFDRVAVRLTRGAEWRCPRSTASSIFAVIEGRGASSVGGTQFEWEAGDMLAVPGWLEHTHAASADAVLLRVSDAPLLRALGWMRENVSGNQSEPAPDFRGGR
jgi:gentisate 1,2-dioxygenase